MKSVIWHSNTQTTLEEAYKKLKSSDSGENDFATVDTKYLFLTNNNHSQLFQFVYHRWQSRH